MTHKRRPMLRKDLQRLNIRKMPLAAAYTALQKVRVPPALQHFLVVVRFQESCMTPAEMFYNMLARRTDIGKYTYRYRVMCNDKAMRIACVMKLGKAVTVRLPICTGS